MIPYSISSKKNISSFGLICNTRINKYSFFFKISGIILSCIDIKGFETKEKYDLFTFHRYGEKCKKKRYEEINMDIEEDKIGKSI